MSLMDGWDHDITGEGLIWTITWDLPLGLTMMAYVTFDELEYLPPETSFEEAWGVRQEFVYPAEAHAYGGKVVRVTVGGHEVSNDILWAEAVKAKVVAIVAWWAERAKLEEMGQL